MIGIILIFLFCWISMFFAGFAVSAMNSRADLLAVTFGFCGYMTWFAQLAVGNISLGAWSSVNSQEWGIAGLFVMLFFGSSLGSGYITGHLLNR